MQILFHDVTKLPPGQPLLKFPKLILSRGIYIASILNCFTFW